MGKLFGGVSKPKVQEVAPAVQAVTSGDTEVDTMNSETKKKKRTGFSSTQVATPMPSETRDTLG